MSIWEVEQVCLAVIYSINKVMRKLLYIIIILIPNFTLAQKVRTINEDDIFLQQIESLSEKSNSGVINFSEIAENLEYIHENKLNLNDVSADELKQLPILDVFQINNFINYRKDNGEIYSIYELTSIHGFSKKTALSILPYIKVEPATKKEFNISDMSKIFDFGRNSLIFRLQTKRPKAEGYIAEKDSLNPKYAGNNNKIYTKYIFSARDKIRFGFTLEKDEGEKFGGEKTVLGYDFSSFHFQLKNLGFVDNIILGDYNLEFGQGLALWSSFSAGKSSDVLNVIKIGRGAVPFSGTNENIFFRGISTKLSFSNIDFTSFLSSNNIDANIVDSEYNIHSSGFHRTEEEIKNKNTLKKVDFGGNVEYKLSRAKVGITFVNTKYNHQLYRGENPYQFFKFSQKSVSNISINYTYNTGIIMSSGEHSTNNYGAWASLHSILINPIQDFNLIVLYRNYQKDYFPIFASPFGEDSSFGEKGYYFGVNIQAIKNIKLVGYYDIFEKTWLQYQKDAPSRGHETLLQLDYYINNSSSFYVRMKHRQKDKNTEIEGNFLNELKKEEKINIRVNFNKIVSEKIKVASRIEFVKYMHINKELGWLIYQDIEYNLRDTPLVFFGRVAFFSSDGFSSSIYAYERDVLYLFTIGTYFNTGKRYYIGAKYKINSKITFWTKFSITQQEDKLFLGSGNNRTKGDAVAEIKIQLRLKF